MFLVVHKWLEEVFFLDDSIFCLNSRIPYFFFQLNKIPEDTRSMMSSATSRTTIDEKVLPVLHL